jgi:hypothetical protein
MLTLLNGAPDEYEDPLKDVECVAVSLSFGRLMLTMFNDDV